MTFSFLDVLFIIIILLLGIIGASKGFIKELFGKGALVIGIWTAVLFYKKLVPFIARHIHINFLCIVLSFLLIFLVAYLVVMIIRQLVGHAFEGEIFNGLDKTLGFVFGMIEGLAIVALILIVIAGQTWFPADNLLGSSFFYKLLKGIITVPIDSFSSMMEKKKIVPVKGAK